LTVADSGATPGCDGVPDYDVVIVGAGPIGLSEALLLARMGWRVGLFERHAARYPLPRAVAMSHDSLRVVQSAGLFEAMKPALDLHYDGVASEFIGEGGEVLFRRRYTAPGESGFPTMTGFNQPDAEAILERAALADPNIDLQRGWVAVGLAQDAALVHVTLEPADPSGGSAEGDRRVVSARFVVGADGANSTVRTLMGVPVHDVGFAADWLVVDIIPKVERTWMIWLGQKIYGRPTTFAPAGPGRRRFEFMLLPHERAADFADKAAAWPLLAEVGATPDDSELVRAAIYTFRGRWAENWRAGRILLAGDAAHQMPPMMAQGFNSGMRDVAALAWRLDLILSGRAPADLLDSYTSERLPHVQQIVQQSVRFGQMICITDPAKQRERDAGLRLVRDGAAPPPPAPAWRLGPGVVAVGDENAGYCGMQGRVEIEGRVGLLDDLIGYNRFVLIARSRDPAAALSAEADSIWRTLGGASLHIAPDGPVRDIGGTYTRWFEQAGADVVLMRPDFQIYGTAKTLAGADSLVRGLARQIGLPANAETQVV